MQRSIQKSLSSYSASWNEWNGEEDKPQDQESRRDLSRSSRAVNLMVPSVDQDMNQSISKTEALDHQLIYLPFNRKEKYLLFFQQWLEVLK